MSEDRNSRILPPALWRQRRSKEQQESRVAPFLELCFKRRGRSVSRIVAIPLQRREGLAQAFELFFALG